MPKTRLRKKYRVHAAGKAAPVDDDGDITLANGDDDIPDAVLAQITSSSDSQAVTTIAAGKKLSRGQRKRLLKKQRFLRQMDGTASALKRAPALSQAELKRRKEQDKGLGGVAGLKDVLNEVAEATIKAAVGASTEPTAPTRFVTGKSRRKLALREKAHLTQVLQHPAYVSDPLGALFQHLQTSLPEPAAPAAPEDDDVVGAGGGSGAAQAPAGSATAQAEAAEAVAVAGRRKGGAAKSRGKKARGRAKFR